MRWFQILKSHSSIWVRRDALFEQCDRGILTVDSQKKSSIITNLYREIVCMYYIMSYLNATKRDFNYLVE